MKRHVSPVVVVLLVVCAFVGVFVVYWKGLLGEAKGKAAKMQGGGGMPPPPITGLPNVTVTTVAGPLPRTSTASDGGYADGRGAAARFDGPSALVVDPQGALYVTDSRNHRIRRVGADGTVTTVAGSGPVGATVGAFADGPADAARLWNPSGIAVAADGSLSVADTGNHRIRGISDGQVRSVAGGDTPLDSFGVQSGDFRDGSGADARFSYPTAIARRPDGSLLVVDTGNRKVRAVHTDGTVSTFADLAGAGAQSPCGIALGPDGRVLVADPGAKAIFVIAAEGAISRLPGINASEPTWINPTGIAVSPQWVIYVADAGSHCVLRIRPGAAPEVIAGAVPRDHPAGAYADGTGDKACFAAPSGLAIDQSGAVYVADYGNNAIRKLVIGPEPPARPKRLRAK